MGKKVSKKENKPDLNNLTPEESLKLEIAEELGLLDRVLENGWKSLSAKETGRIGGLLGKRKKAMKQEALRQAEEENTGSIG
ncbi:MAG: small, acid-soluble spore protein, alpha/beta type [Lachnospiraceae bacterium]|nr:small, acid-soluble spore protein, alpha/beta type [Lachnospiraceae bacterium]